MNKEYYIAAWNEFWKKCLQDAQEVVDKNDLHDDTDVVYLATEIFEDVANAEQIVGYYITYHLDYALEDWLCNTKGLKFNEQDKEVDRILKELYST